MLRAIEFRHDHAQEVDLRVCGFTTTADGDPDGGIPAGTSFDDHLPRHLVLSVCGAQQRRTSLLTRKDGKEAPAGAPGARALEAPQARHAAGGGRLLRRPVAWATPRDVPVARVKGGRGGVGLGRRRRRLDRGRGGRRRVVQTHRRWASSTSGPEGALRGDPDPRPHAKLIKDGTAAVAR